MTSTLTGVEAIDAERRRQIEEKGYTPDKDVGHEKELVDAAESYLLVARSGKEGWVEEDGTPSPPGGWPWSKENYHPENTPQGNLIKAGALIAAAIDALNAPPRVYTIGEVLRDEAELLLLPVGTVVKQNSENSFNVFQKSSKTEWASVGTGDRFSGSQVMSYSTRSVVILFVPSAS